MPLNCENKVDSMSVCMKVKKRKERMNKRKRGSALKSICDSDAMLNAPSAPSYFLCSLDSSLCFFHIQCSCVHAICTSKQKLKQNKILLKVENLKEWKRWRRTHTHTQCWHQQCKWQSSMNVKYEYRAGRQ